MQMVKPLRFLPGVLAAAVVCLVPAHPSAGGRATGGPILVSAAASLTDALTAIAHQYESTTGDTVTLNFGPSSGLARQIVNGAPVDVFLSADEAQMDFVAKAGLLKAGTRVDLLANQLVVVMPAGRAHPLSSPRDLTAASFRRIALADPAAVPAGVYAREYLQALGLWTAIQPKVVPTLDVRAALAAVDSGNADAAFVYRTDAAIGHRAAIVFSIPVTEGPRIRYPAAVVSDAPHPAAAVAFLAFLRGPQARAVFEHYGFIVASR
ncbi:MAG: molybdate ABC transporter substrate-binding protein [Acidobacteriota bacterium]|nr:molybdate ABC transporter substrate-binding protein [Acidobacteriota bacterium]